MSASLDKPQLSKEQLTGLILLAIFGVLILVFGGLQLRNTIYNPFSLADVEPLSADVLANEAVILQQTDTDGDGLSDFDETEFYQTSIYLADSDSDGVSDGDEIAQGENPLCARGDDCDVVLAPPSSNENSVGEDSSTAIEETFGAAVAENDLSSFPSSLEDVPAGSVPTAPEDVALDDTFAGATINMEALLQDPAMLRELLLSTGTITQEQLRAFDDETLLELAQQLAAQQESIGTQTTP